MESARLKSRANALPDGCEWYFDREEGGDGHGNLLLVAGKHNGIVVACIESNQRSSWTLVLDAHHGFERQVRMVTGSIAEAIEICELWASLHRERLLRYG